jgi:hypothetical protein
VVICGFLRLFSPVQAGVFGSSKSSLWQAKGIRQDE